MQIYALDSSSVLIFADDANKHQDYQCVECYQTIRLRRGLHRKAHFYHVVPNRTCKQHAKGMPHLMLQQYLKNIMPQGEVELECQFETIGRIADVAWHPKRLVYEIQCSPISAEEVMKRNENYASMGYQVVWIFHDERYNQHRLSAAEDFLRDQPHYFSDMNAEGEGKIYDQFSMIINGRRVRRLPILPIDPSLPKFLKFPNVLKGMVNKLPFILHRRANMWPVFFSGDTIDSCINFEGQSSNHTDNQKELVLQLQELSSQQGRLPIVHLWKNRKQLFQEYVLRPYLSLIKLILERASEL